jgi:FkbM family methyltransferase
MSWLDKRFRGTARRLFRSAGYDVGSIAKRREREALLRAERWGWLETLGIGTLIDVGANTGQFALLFRDVRPGCLIYSFEPLRDCFEQLQQNMRDTPGFAAFNVALGEQDGESEFFRSGSSPSSSLLPMSRLHKELFPSTRDVTPESVTVRRLDTFVDDVPIRGGLLIKIDVQGAETQVLKGGRLLLSRADAVLAEVSYLSLYEGQATFEEILGLLSGLEFQFVGMVDQYLRRTDSLPVFGDALFIKRAALEQCEASSASDAISQVTEGAM